MDRTVRTGWLALTLLSLSARADGIPTVEPLSFTGLVELPSGAPAADGPHAVTVGLFDLATGGAVACTTSATVVSSRGVIRVPLVAGCTLAVQTTPNLFAELTFEGQLLTPRLKLGAAPFAVEAARAGTLNPAAMVSGAQISPGSLTADRLAPDGGFVTSALLRRARVVTAVATASGTSVTVAAACNGATEIALSGGCQGSSGAHLNQNSPSGVLLDGGSTANGGFLPTAWICAAEGTAPGFSLYAYVTCQPLE